MVIEVEKLGTLKRSYKQWMSTKASEVWALLVNDEGVSEDGESQLHLNTVKPELTMAEVLDICEHYDLDTEIYQRGMFEKQSDLNRYGPDYDIACVLMDAAFYLQTAHEDQLIK